MRLCLAIASRRFKRRQILGGVLLLFAVWTLYLMLFHLADSLITSFRKHAADAQATRAPPRRRMETSVVVAHYIGAGNLFGNLSDDIMNQNFYEPRASEGANGRPVAISARESLKMQHLFAINRYNLLASDRIPLNRTLPDQRKKICRTIDYDTERLPNTTVIVVFHNEAWSVLLRTVWSVINRTPAGLLHEILLVDDASTRTFLGAALDAYCATLPVRVRVLRQPERSGLVPARLLGARNTTGATLTFLDAHCECTPGWLQPLLARIRDDRRTVACPVIDIISDDNFGYVRSFELHSGAFNWQLHFRWYMRPEHEWQQRRSTSNHSMVDPFATPAMAGGLFSVQREYFEEIGAYDAQMRIWGGENLEMSWRVWQCGGRVEIVPCSHVGHLFRRSSPYTFPGGVQRVLNGNVARAAMVWMDGWAAFYFRYQGVDGRTIAAMNVTDRLELRKRLDCKPFSWYLQNVWPDHFFPGPDRLFAKVLLLDVRSPLYADYVGVFADYDFSRNLDLNYTIGYLTERTDRLQRLFGSASITTAFCLQAPQARVLGQGATGGNGAAATNLALYGQALLRRCLGDASGGMQELFVWKPNGQIATNEGICVDAVRHYGGADGDADAGRTHVTPVRIVQCDERAPRQRWLWDARQLQLRADADATRCLTATGSDDDLLNAKSAAEFRAELTGRVRSTDRTFNVTVQSCEAVAAKETLQKWVLLPMPWR